MALRVLNINPLRAAINPEGVPEGSMMLSQNALDIVHQVKQVSCLIFMVSFGNIMLILKVSTLGSGNLQHYIKG